MRGASLLLCACLAWPVHAQEAQWGEPKAVGQPAAAAKDSDQAAKPNKPELDGRPAAKLHVLREWLDLPALLPLSAAGPALTMPQALRLGLDNSPDVQAATYREQSFVETSNAARGALLPKLELRASSGRGRLQSADPKLALNRRDATAVFSQSLVDEPARLEWNRQELLAASAQVQREGAESQALLDTANAWLAVMQQRVSLELGDRYEQMLGELLKYISDRAAAGGTSPAERDRVAARVANLRSNLADSRAGLAAALRNLQRLAAALPGAVTLEGGLEFAVPGDAESAITQARSANADIRSSELEQRAGEFERASYKGRFLPRVSVEVTHLSSTNASGTEAYQRDNKAMAVVTVPLLNGGTDWAQQQAAEYRRLETAARGEGTMRRVVQDIETAYANLRASGERLTTVREELEGNRKVVDAFRAQLQGGNRQLLDVIDAYQRLHQSRLDLVQVYVATLQNEMRIAHLIGTLRNQVPAR